LGASHILIQACNGFRDSGHHHRVVVMLGRWKAEHGEVSLVDVAVGAGSLLFSTYEAGFWVVKKYFGMKSGGQGHHSPRSIMSRRCRFTGLTVWFCCSGSLVGTMPLTTRVRHASRVGLPCLVGAVPVMVLPAITD